MLDLLVKYALEHGLAAEPGFKRKQVRWAIALSTEGRFLEVIPLGDAEGETNLGREFPMCPDLSQPDARLVSIPGQPPRLNAVPAGCRFAPRCPMVIERCRLETPAVRQVRPGRWATCHRIDEAGV